MPNADTKQRTLYLTTMDLCRLRDVIATVQAVANGSMPTGIRSLEAMLKDATIAPAEYLPANVVTLGSKIRIKESDTGRSREVIVSLPGDCAQSDQCLSVLDPVGSATLGRTAGESFSYAGNPSTREATVEEVIYQPVDCEWC